MRRKEELVCGEVYHIYNKSIAGFKIFNNKTEYSRIKDMIRYYHVKDMSPRFSWFMEQSQATKDGFLKHFIKTSKDRKKLIQIIAYCVMPTHIHLILKQLEESGISIFMGNILNSYSRYFNTKHKRKGPLWESRFQNVLVQSDEQLLHLTRYIHLNPATAQIVNKPEEWQMSSYGEYLNKIDSEKRICEYNDVLDIEPTSYKNFVNDRVSYQRELAIIKALLLEEQ